MRSTAEWEAALEGTTEGNWIQAQGVEVWAEGDNGVNLYVGSAYQHNESREDNARLFVLAPEAVAEVVRLRRELAKVGEVLARLDREYATVATSNPRPGRDEYAAGYLAGIDTAYTWLQKALDGTHE